MGVSTEAHSGVWALLYFLKNSNPRLKLESIEEMSQKRVNKRRRDREGIDARFVPILRTNPGCDIEYGYTSIATSKLIRLLWLKRHIEAPNP